MSGGDPKVTTPPVALPAAGVVPVPEPIQRMLEGAHDRALEAADEAAVAERVFSEMVDHAARAVLPSGTGGRWEYQRERGALVRQASEPKETEE